MLDDVVIASTSAKLMMTIDACRVHLAHRHAEPTTKAPLNNTEDAVSMHKLSSEHFIQSMSQSDDHCNTEVPHAELNLDMACNVQGALYNV